MDDQILSFLSHDWAGLVIAFFVGALGTGLILVARAKGARWVAGIGYGVLGVAGLMTLGSSYHLIHMAGIRAQYPPPGIMVDIGGYRLHVLAEGDTRGKPTIVWMPGGHTGGFYLYHLHRMMRDEARSILIDRPGTGWSDAGPFPRTSAVEAMEVVTALEKSGEKGPFVLAGHSFGGLLMANIARRRPDIVAGLVLLDATPPDAINYAPPNPSLTRRYRVAVPRVLQRLFGIHPQFVQRLWGRDPGPDPIDDLIEKQLGAALEQLHAVEEAPRSICAWASISAELAPGGLGWETTVYDGDLGDMRVFLVAPREMSLEESRMVKAMAENSGVDETRLRRLYRYSRERYLAVSSRSERIYAPDGTGHIFPYEELEFVADVVRRMLLEHPRPTLPTLSHND